MMLTHLTSQNGKYVVHSLDFDIVSVADNEREAWEKHTLAIKTYVEFGISNGWQEYIIFPAPQELWDKITPDTPTQIRPPIMIAGVERKVIEVHEAQRAA